MHLLAQPEKSVKTQTMEPLLEDGTNDNNLGSWDQRAPPPPPLHNKVEGKATKVFHYEEDQGFEHNHVLW